MERRYRAFGFDVAAPLPGHEGLLGPPPAFRRTVQRVGRHMAMYMLAAAIEAVIANSQQRFSPAATSTNR